MKTSILTTKFFIPKPRKGLITRPQLLEQLDAGLDKQFTLISAPAGYGKTTLVSEWVCELRKAKQTENKIKYKIAWLSLDESDNDPIRFLLYFISSLIHYEVIKPLFGEELTKMLQIPSVSSIDNVLTDLINELTGVAQKIIYVIDDYHLIDIKSVNEALNFLIENMPPQLHLVIVTREDPQFSQAKMRGKGQLTELRAADLRFTTDEASEYLNNAMRLDLRPEDIVALEQRTEGWIAGLQLAALSLHGRGNSTKLIYNFSGTHRYVADYLIEEVLNRQPEVIRTFLLQTSILDRLSGSLCNAVSGETNSQHILEDLERSNLFITPLDNDRNWYRYHHLFADLLKQKLRQYHIGDLTNLHRQASGWYQQMGFLQDAIKHAIAGNDHERVAALAERAWFKWNTPAKMLTWFKWVSILPSEIVHMRPVLGIACAQALLNEGLLEAADKRLNDIEELITQPDAEMIIEDEEEFAMLPARLATVRAYHAMASSDAQKTVQYVEKALELYPQDDSYNRAAVKGFLGLSFWSNGNLIEALQIYSQDLFQNDHDEIKGTFVIADMNRDLGQLREAQRVCEQGIKLAKAHDPLMPTGTEDIFSYLGEIFREQGKLDQAAQNLATAKSLGEKVSLPDWEHRWYIAQAQVENSLGNLDAALDLLDKASRLFVRTPVPNVRPIPAMQTRILIKQGRLSEAQHWADERNLSVDGALDYIKIFEYVTLVRLFIAREFLVQAQKLLERLQQASENGGWGRSLIEILILRSLVSKKLGLDSLAYSHLEQALGLAEPEGFVQVFIDEGPEMGTLLYGTLSRDIDPHFVQHLLTSYPANNQDQVVSVSELEDTDWVEPLSEREVEILSLIAEGLTNQEIAVKIFLSLNTIKAHTRNIYGKLGVKSRTQAVAKARTLGIL